MDKSIPIDPFWNVINFSKLLFSKYQYELLNKNLNFCPTPERYNKNEVINDFKEFKRKIKLNTHFALQENHDFNQLNYEKKYNTKKKFGKPDKNHHTVSAFIEAINDIENLLKHLLFRNQTLLSRKKNSKGTWK